jgi:hypothetical protein
VNKKAKEHFFFRTLPFPKYPQYEARVKDGKAILLQILGGLFAGLFVKCGF